MESFAELSKLKLDLPDDHPLLITLAKRFEVSDSGIVMDLCVVVIVLCVIEFW